MTAGALSKNEKLTLYGLVRFPTHNDRLLGEEIKLKMSTVTAIRNRLKRDGYFKTVRIPNLERLGGELLVVTQMRLNIVKPREEILRVLREAIGGMEDVFYAFADQFQLVTFSFCRNYTDAWTDSERGHQLLSEKGALGTRYSRRQTLIFPLNQTKMFRFFDFHKTLNQQFGLRYPEPEPQLSLKMERPQPRRLSRIEKRVYLGLINRPEMVDNEVAGKIGVTRQSVTKIRKRLETEGLLSTVRIPDMQKTGADILAIAYYESGPNVTLVTRKKGIEWVNRETPLFFHVAGNREGLLMALASTFRGLQNQLLMASRLYMEKGYLRRDPYVTMLSVPELAIIKDFTFAPVVKKVLEIEDEK